MYSAQFDEELRNKIMILKLKIVDITLLEKTQVTENRVLVRISSGCQLLVLVDIEQSLELGIRFPIPNPISSLRCLKEACINTCSPRAPSALIIISRIGHVSARGTPVCNDICNSRPPYVTKANPK
jgi:hypothetical protein